MKKVLTVLGLMFLLGATTSVQAAPMGPGGHHGGHMAPPTPHSIHNAAHHRVHHMMPPPPRHYHHRSHVVIGGYYPRHSYWGYPCYDYALGCDRFYYPRPYYDNGVYVNVGFPIRF